jgi:hypothetical protein
VSVTISPPRSAVRVSPSTTSVLSKSEPSVLIDTLSIVYPAVSDALPSPPATVRATPDTRPDAREPLTLTAEIPPVLTLTAPLTAFLS